MKKGGKGGVKRGRRVGRGGEGEERKKEWGGG